MNWISFPGLGIGPFGIDPVAFNLFGKKVAWYGIIICLGIVLSFFFAKSRAKKYEGITDDSFIDLAIFMIPAAIIGARLYYVIFYGGYDSFSDIIAVWNGGLAIYGGLIAGLATVLIFSKIKKVSPMKYLDPIASSVFIGQAIGRWGNFVNAEAHGGETDLPWRMGISLTENGDVVCYHPTFFYESLWNVIGFVVALFLYRKKKFSGQIFLFYTAWYGLGRGLIELLRTDSLTAFGGSVRVSSLLGFLCFVFGTSAYIILSVRAKKVENEAAGYESLYSAKSVTDEEKESVQTEEAEESDD